MLKTEQVSLLNAVGENIFITDEDFNIVFLNNRAKKMMEQMKNYIQIETPEDIIGMNMKSFHKGNKQKVILENEELPYETAVNLFGKYTAHIVIDSFVTKEYGKSYILTWKDVTEQLEQLEEMYTPVLETSVKSAVLIPIVGRIYYERTKIMSKKLLEVCSERRIEYMILDFTGITSILDQNLLHFIEYIGQSLHLMGVEVIHVGFPIELVQQMVHNGIGVSEKTFRDFEKAIRYIWEKEGYILEKK